MMNGIAGMLMNIQKILVIRSTSLALNRRIYMILGVSGRSSRLQQKSAYLLTLPRASVHSSYLPLKVGHQGILVSSLSMLWLVFPLEVTGIKIGY